MNNIETAEQLAEIIETTGCDQRYSTMIAGETFAWYRAYDPEANVEYLHEQGYYQTVTDDDFWAVCANHAL